MERIEHELARELGQLGPAAGMAEIVSAWAGAVGDAVARNAWPARLGRDGTLHVAAASSLWAFELTQLEGDVRARLRAALGDTAPTRIRFAPGRLPEPPREEAAEEARERPLPTAAHVAEADALAAGASDAELRALVARAAAASLARGSAGRGV